LPHSTLYRGCTVTTTWYCMVQWLSPVRCTLGITPH